MADPAHIFVVGESNGGLMAWTLACQMSGRLTGVASVIIGMIERQAKLCHPKRLTPLLVIAGTEDWTQAYDGAMGQVYRLMSIPETLEFWRRLHGCASLNLDGVPRHEPTDRTRAIRVAWTECQDPSPQHFIRIEGGGHFLPSFASLAPSKRHRHSVRSQAIEAAEEIWAFFHAAAP